MVSFLRLMLATWTKRIISSLPMKFLMQLSGKVCVTSIILTQGQPWSGLLVSWDSPCIVHACAISSPVPLLIPLHKKIGTILSSQVWYTKGLQQQCILYVPHLVRAETDLPPPCPLHEARLVYKYFLLPCDFENALASSLLLYMHVYCAGV